MGTGQLGTMHKSQDVAKRQYRRFIKTTDTYTQQKKVLPKKFDRPGLHEADKVDEGGIKRHGGIKARPWRWKGKQKRDNEESEKRADYVRSVLHGHEKYDPEKVKALGIGGMKEAHTPEQLVRHRAYHEREMKSFADMRKRGTKKFTRGNAAELDTHERSRKHARAVDAADKLLRKEGNEDYYKQRLEQIKKKTEKKKKKFDPREEDRRMDAQDVAAEKRKHDERYDEEVEPRTQIAQDTQEYLRTHRREFRQARRKETKDARKKSGKRWWQR
jgi:hypothetical protein